MEKQKVADQESDPVVEFIEGLIEGFQGNKAQIIDNNLDINNR